MRHYAFMQNNKFTFLQYLVPEALEVLHVRSTKICMFSGIFKAKWAILPPRNNIAVVLYDARARAMSFWDRISVRINLIKNVLPVSSSW